MDDFDKNNALTVLGIETTCDETAASVVSLDKNGISKLHSNIIHSQYEEHSELEG
jgi:Metal-dependent proteases with possible chaperone activity